MSSTVNFIEENKNKKSILVYNYKYVISLIKELESENKNYFINYRGDIVTIDDLRISKRLYSKAIRKLKEV